MAAVCHMTTPPPPPRPLKNNECMTPLHLVVSDITPTDRWLNVWCIWQTKLETLQVSKSSLDWLNYTGFPGDVCVAFFNVLPGNKGAVMPNSLKKKKAVVFTTVTTRAYQDQLNTGFSKVCEICEVCGIESSKSFTHQFVIVATLPRP